MIYCCPKRSCTGQCTIHFSVSLIWQIKRPFVSIDTSHQWSLQQQLNDSLIRQSFYFRKVSDNIAGSIKFQDWIFYTNSRVILLRVVNIKKLSGKACDQSNFHCRLYLSALTAVTYIVALIQELLGQIDHKVGLVFSDLFTLKESCSCKSPTCPAVFLIFDNGHNIVFAPIEIQRRSNPDCGI